MQFSPKSQVLVLDMCGFIKNNLPLTTVNIIEITAGQSLSRDFQNDRNAKKFQKLA